MITPRLTIGIPTLDRPELLRRAIGSCLKQTVPVCIVVADQGQSAETADVVKWAIENALDEIPVAHPHVIVHVASEATNVWENWRRAAEWPADTEFFAWLQDDDIIAANYARRIVDAFDAFPSANTWTARLAIAVSDTKALPCLHNGPLRPFDLLRGRPEIDPGALMPPLVYFTSWSMSPGAAFRRGAAFDRALARVIPGCDLFTERMILAAMGLGGDVVSDPILAGYWMQHDKNESKNQHAGQQAQVSRMVEWADAAMRDCPGWRDAFEPWVRMMPTGHKVGFLQELQNPAYKGSEYAGQVAEVIARNLMDISVAIPAPPDSLRSIARDAWSGVRATAGRLRGLAVRPAPSTP